MFSVEFLKIYFQQIQNKVIWKLFCVYIMLCTIARKTDQKIKRGDSAIAIGYVLDSLG